MSPQKTRLLSESVKETAFPSQLQNQYEKPVETLVLD